MSEQLNDILAELASLQKWRNTVFESNRQYYATQDTAKAQVLESLILKMFGECLDKIGEKD